MSQEALEKWVQEAKKRDMERQELERYCLANDKVTKDLINNVDSRRVVLARQAAQEEALKSREDSLHLEMMGILRDFETERGRRVHV